MREITKEVEDGTYPQLMGRGLLRFRTWELGESETKHIVELAHGHIAYIRRTQNSALIVEADVLTDGMPSLVGINDILDVDHVFLYTPDQNPDYVAKMGLVYRSVRMYKAGGYTATRPDDLEIDTVLTPEETATLFNVAEDVPVMRQAVQAIGDGLGYVSRLPSPHGDTLVITVNVPGDGLYLSAFHSMSGQDTIRALDAFNYLVSTAKFGMFTDEVEDGELNPTCLYLQSLGFTPHTYIYAITRTPQGEANAN